MSRDPCPLGAGYGEWRQLNPLPWNWARGISALGVLASIASLFSTKYDLVLGLELWVLPVSLTLHAAFLALACGYVFLHPQPLRSTNPEYSATNSAVARFHDYWNWIWVGWLVLYVILAASEFSQTNLRQKELKSRRALTEAYESGIKSLEQMDSAIREERFPGTVTIEGSLTNWKQDQSERRKLIQDRVGAWQFARRHRTNIPPADPSTPLMVSSKDVDFHHNALLSAETALAGALRPIRLATNTVNNLVSLLFLLGYYALARAPGTPNRSGRRGVLSVGAALVLVLFALEQIDLSSHADPGRLRAFAWASGLLAGLAMALYFERLASLFIGSHVGVTIALFFYAVIQVAWVDFPRQPVFMVIMTTLAIHLKLLLLLFVTWTLDSGILYFYLYSVRQLTRLSRRDPQRRAIEIIRARLLRRIMDRTP